MNDPLALNDIPGWFIEWAARHIRTFSLPDKAIETLASWSATWSVNFTPMELNAATQDMLHDRTTDKDGNLRTNFTNNHRMLVPESVAKIRAKQRSREAMAVAERSDGVCMFCDDAGFVVVPHPGKDPHARTMPAPLADFLTAEPHWHNADGEPQWPTLSVLCDCRLGRFILGRQEDSVSAGKVKQRCVTLAEYERKYGNWREVDAAIRARRAATRRPFDANAAADAIRGMIEKLRRDRSGGRRTVLGPEPL